MPSDFSSQDYWQTRFKEEEKFEWLSESDVIVPIVLVLINEIKSYRALHSTSPTYLRSTYPEKDEKDGKRCPSSHTPRGVEHQGLHRETCTEVEEESNLSPDKSAKERLRKEIRKCRRAEISRNAITDDEDVNILHFGCGTSLLGQTIQEDGDVKVFRGKVTDADYAADQIREKRELGNGRSSPVDLDQLSISNSSQPSSGTLDKIADSSRLFPPLIQLDVLDPNQLSDTAPKGGWDIVVDKSTADAVSCGPDIPRSALCPPSCLPSPPRLQSQNPVINQRPSSTSNSSKENEKLVQGDEEEYDDSAILQGEDVVEPIHLLCANLARVVKRGGYWLCISYSSTRFDHLKKRLPGTGVKGKHDPGGQGEWEYILGEPLEGGDGNTSKDGPIRIVYEPEVHVWAYILQRI